MSTTTIWHNPKCAKSREGLEILQTSGCDFETLKYLDTTITAGQIQELLKLLGISAHELMRTKEEIYKELDLKNETDENRLIQAMVQHPKLIERPIVIQGNRAIIGRPSSRIVEFLKS
jgi:arsenate reductase